MQDKELTARQRYWLEHIQSWNKSGKWPNPGSRDSATIMFTDFKGLHVLPKHLNSVAQVRTNQHIFRTLSLKGLTILIFPQTHYEYRGILKMKILKQLAAASIVILLLSPQVYANSLALRFLGTGDIKSLADTLGEIGIDLRKDTNLSPGKIAELETYIAGCWAVPMVDPSSEIPLGTGIDCLWPLDGAADTQGEGISLEALSFFVFNSGTIITLGLTSVRPFRVGGIGDAGGDVTHITGSIPSDKTGVIGGTGSFKGKGGAARVSGAVFLGDFPNEITFDCLWIIGVEDLPPGRAK